MYSRGGKPACLGGVRALVTGEPLLKAILAAIDEGIHVVDTRGVTVFYNEVAAAIDGLSPAEVVGRHVLETFPSLTSDSSTLLKVLATRRPVAGQQQTFTNFKGRRVTTVNSTFPIRVEGKLAGALEVSKDITQVQELSERVVDLQAELLQHKRGRTPAVHGTAAYTLDDLDGEDPRFLAVKERAKRAALSSSPVLVLGETGTGKELLVHALHHASARRDKPFIAQNCAALPEGLLEGLLFGTVRGSFTGAEDRPGLFELANGGTLFLDEIHAMAWDLQAKLLRVLQDGRVRRIGESSERPLDVRVVCSCNQDPLLLVAEKRLREDLFYRINVVALELPPLRERRDDIPLLVRRFLERHRARIPTPAEEFSRPVLDFFLEYHWPGNVRELEHAVEGALNLAHGRCITLDDLPPHLLRARRGQPVAPAPHSGAPLRSNLTAAEREAVRQALERSGWNLSEAARVLGLPRQTLQYRIKRLGLKR